MEKIIKQVPVYKTEKVQVGTKPVEMFKCSDGSVHSTESGAIVHEHDYMREKKHTEAREKLATIEQISASEDTIGLYVGVDSHYVIYGSWIRFKSNEEVETFIQSIGVLHSSYANRTHGLYSKKRYKLNEWLLVIMKENNDSDYSETDIWVETKRHIKIRIIQMKEAIPED